MTENIGDYNINVIGTVWVLSHEYEGIMGTKFAGIDGVFDSDNAALNAKKICEKDKPHWHFMISEQKLISDIWQAK